LFKNESIICRNESNFTAAGAENAEVSQRGGERFLASLKCGLIEPEMT